MLPSAYPLTGANFRTVARGFHRSVGGFRAAWVSQLCAQDVLRLSGPSPGPNLRIPFFIKVISWRIGTDRNKEC
ncbi:hypothetical protein RRG08_062749 [Elysia crispata]|uniref:Uncharacterized protein n=1 Tax=Elysia crispata TaxID=231223 RepID=A0AAE1D0Y6_9GAST|nr:hypothetical protein RRG08_062749 [Elysia crispata]